MRKAMEFLVPYIRDKKIWPHDDDWPTRQISLLFAARAYDEPGYQELWKRLPADSQVEEVMRNFFLRQPVLWVK